MTELKKQRLAWRTKLAFGIGHVFNDLCASMWFSYLLIFYEKVLLFNSTVAGLVLLVGQIADGVSTPVVGIFSDKQNKIPACAKFGRRKVWHLLGTVLVAVSFPFIFAPCLGCEDAEDWSQLAYYAVFVCVFQFGWACVQIAHLALIPDLTNSKSQRTELSSIRYAFTVLANLAVFTITYLVLKVDQGGEGVECRPGNVTAQPLNDCPTNDQVGPEDLTNFRDIALICVGTGVVFSLLFHVGVREPPFIPPAKADAEGNELGPTDQGATKKMKKLDWFKELPFYQIAVLYMATRLYVNLYQVYIPLYMQDTLGLDSTYIATVPFAMYLAGFLGSLGMKYVNIWIGRKRTFALGCVVGLGGCVWVWFGQGGYFTTWGIFLVAALLGIGGSTLLITSLSITADLIGANVEGGAFVYGFMSLVDKFSNGIIIMVIQNSNPGDGWYYRSVITFACGASCLLGILVTITLARTRVGQRRSSDVLQIMDDEATEDDKGPQGIDNPALSTISDGQLDTKPVSACQLRAEDTPSMCQLGLADIPKACDGDKQDKVSSISEGQVDTKPVSACQLRAEDTPAMCQLGVADIAKACGDNSSDSDEDREDHKL